MLQGISGLPTTSETNSSSTTKSNELGQDSFMTMFLAQLKYQDPLNPMDGQEFAAQLAQFTSLEQLYNVNDNLENMISTQGQDARFQALDFIGKEIEAEGNILVLEEGENAKGGFSLESRAFCSVQIFDEQGTPVKKVYLGPLEPGAHNFQWDGLNDSGGSAGAGTYGFEVTAVAENGELLDVETRVVGEVTRVGLEGDSPLLYVGDLAVELSQVKDIRIPEPSSENPDSTSGIPVDEEAV